MSTVCSWPQVFISIPVLSLELQTQTTIRHHHRDRKEQTCKSKTTFLIFPAKLALSTAFSITFGKKLNPSFCSCQKPWESSLTLLSHPHIQSTRKSCWLYLQNTLSSHHLHRYHPSHHHFLPGSSQQSQDYLQHNSWSNLLKYIMSRLCSKSPQRLPKVKAKVLKMHSTSHFPFSNCAPGTPGNSQGHHRIVSIS